MSRPSLPSFEDVTSLPTRLDGLVTPDFIDANGHMNVQHYLRAAASGASAWCEEIGIDDDYRAQRRLGVFTNEHHIRYFSEMHEGDSFSVHTAAVGRTDKVVHVVAMLADRTRRVLACCVEIILVHVDMDSRRPVGFPDDVATMIDAATDRTSGISWALPLSGGIGLRP
ncbi:thioesterase family protein [Nocardioides halotolerans]|uniref:thioesterase family protein n=1 Tax=Nocardioides halotolerans TaxID=433660 RepID=UPI00041603C9|nr:thioesterase family protein [Nocardioides halotolerans]